MINIEQGFVSYHTEIRRLYVIAESLYPGSCFFQVTAAGVGDARESAEARIVSFRSPVLPAKPTRSVYRANAIIRILCIANTGHLNRRAIRASGLS